MATRTKSDALSKGFALPAVPKRSAVPEETARKFVAPPKEAKESKLRRETVGERVAVYLPPAMAQELRVRCAADRRSVSDAVTEAVALWIYSAKGT